MEQDTKFVGLDEHKATMAVAVAAGQGGEAQAVGTIPNTPEAVARLVRKRGPAAGLVCCYEAGPWRESGRLGQPPQQIVLGEYRLAVDQAQERLQRLEAESALAAQQGPPAAVLAAVQTLRGVGRVTAATLVAELGDRRRFRSPRELMAYVGRVPREASSGPRRRRGAVTKTGNRQVRHVVEAAWH